MEAVLQKLMDIEKILNKIRSGVINKTNLYYPEYRTLKDLLETIDGMLSDISAMKNSYKIDYILEKLDSIEKLTVTSRVDDLRRACDEITK